MILKCDHELVDVTWTRYEAGELGPDPHIHEQHADAWDVLEGEVEFFLDGVWHRTGPGTFLSVPPDIVHGFRPCGEPFRLLNIHAPNTGFVDSLRE